MWTPLHAVAFLTLLAIYLFTVNHLSKLANQQVMGVSNQGGPDAALIGSADENEEPECRQYEAEDGHEHHPAQRVDRLDTS